MNIIFYKSNEQDIKGQSTQQTAVNKDAEQEKKKKSSNQERCWAAMPSFGAHE